jgi:hypothetical protein
VETAAVEKNDETPVVSETHKVGTEVFAKVRAFVFSYTLERE